MFSSLSSWKNVIRKHEASVMIQRAIFQNRLKSKFEFQCKHGPRLNRCCVCGVRCCIAFSSPCEIGSSPFCHNSGGSCSRHASQSWLCRPCGETKLPDLVVCLLSCNRERETRIACFKCAGLLRWRKHGTVSSSKAYHFLDGYQLYLCLAAPYFNS